MTNPAKTLIQIVAQKPFPDFAAWWPMGDRFIHFMAEAIMAEWRLLPQNNDDLKHIQQFVSQYLQIVYQQSASPSLLLDFANRSWQKPMQSGEFDALSYAFYRSAFELIAAHPAAYKNPVARERRLFTKRVGKRFFNALHDYLDLNLPASLHTPAQFEQLQQNIRRVGDFLQTEGYLRDNFDFRFEVNMMLEGIPIIQTSQNFLTILHQYKVGYAFYEMGYPVILPSAVYLYHTIGEAQHHSSRTIEELFARVGCDARETDDFDPSGFPSDKVIELWEIRQREIGD